jgi:hypothetical protein
MQWAESRIMRKRAAFAADERGQRRVFELFDGRCLIEFEGAPPEIVEGTFDEALGKAAALTVALAVPARVSWWRRLVRALGGRP